MLVVWLLVDGGHDRQGAIARVAVLHAGLIHERWFSDPTRKQSLHRPLRAHAMGWHAGRKDGRSTGGTVGRVTNTRENVGARNPDGTDSGWAYICQYRADYASAGGDSGSPVWDDPGRQGYARFVGLNWGGNGSTALFSSAWALQLAHELDRLGACKRGLGNSC